MPVPENLPEHAKKILEDTMAALKGKINKRTGKEYTDEERGMIAWSAVKEKYKKVGDNWEAKSLEEFGFLIEPMFADFQFKADEFGKHFFKGYLSTFDVDLVNDVVTPECMEDMLRQINDGINGYARSMKGSLDHDVYWTGDNQKTPASRITSGKVDSKGLFVEGMFNPDHPDFKNIWSQVQNGFLDGLSIEYKPVDFAFRDVAGKKIRILNKVMLKGYGHTPRPANPHSTLTEIFAKSLDLANAQEIMETKSHFLKHHITEEAAQSMLKDEKESAVWYREHGFPEISKDEEAHAKVWENLIQEEHADKTKGGITVEENKNLAPAIPESVAKQIDNSMAPAERPGSGAIPNPAEAVKPTEPLLRNEQMNPLEAKANEPVDHAEGYVNQGMRRMPETEVKEPIKEPEKEGEKEPDADDEDEEAVKARVTAQEEHRKKMGHSEEVYYAFPRLKKLPIFDEAHVRNAMARFNQTQGMSAEEKASAKRKINAAAKKHGIDVEKFKDVPESKTDANEPMPEKKDMALAMSADAAQIKSEVINQITKIVKEETKSIQPENKSLPDSTDKFDVKSLQNLTLTQLVAKGLGG